MIPYEKLSAALDAHRRRVRGEPEPEVAAEPEVVDASDLVAEEDSWTEPASEQGEQWGAEQDYVEQVQPEQAPPALPTQPPAWDGGQEEQPLQTTDEWQAEVAQDAEPQPEAQPVDNEQAVPFTADEWAEAPAPEPPAEQPAEEQWPQEPATTEQPAQAEEAWPEEPPISPEDFAPPEQVDMPPQEVGAQDDEWAIPTAPPAPEAQAEPQAEELPPPPVPEGTPQEPPAQGQPARTIFGMPAPPTQPPPAPDEEPPAPGQTDDLVIVDDDSDPQQ